MPPGASPSLLIPKPAPGAGGDPARLAQLEVQLQSTRAALTRASDDIQAAVRRAEAAEARATQLAERIAALEAATTEAQQALSARVEQAMARAERPVALEPLEARLEKLDQDTARARVAIATAQQELAEHGRLFESRKVRLDSFDARLGRIEADPRLAELNRSIERLDLKLTAIETGRDLGTIVARIAALEARREQAAVRPPSTRPPRKAESEPAGLRAIKGLGPKYQKQLGELGITTPAQLAAWTDADLDRVAAHLGMPRKKLEKLGWIAAAKAVVAG
jgi:predicted flap endonuclease-1-like 5' DNA nuclease